MTKPTAVNLSLKDKEENENDTGDGADRDDLAFEISLRAFLDRAGDLAHPLVAGREPNDRLDQEKGEDQAQDGANHRKA